MHANRTWEWPLAFVIGGGLFTGMFYVFSNWFVYYPFWISLLSGLMCMSLALVGWILGRRERRATVTLQSSDLLEMALSHLTEFWVRERALSASDRIQLNRQSRTMYFLANEIARLPTVATEDDVRRACKRALNRVQSEAFES